jgi:hypothetical protein
MFRLMHVFIMFFTVVSHVNYNYLYSASYLHCVAEFLFCFPTNSTDELTIDYIFTFNLSYEENKYYTRINFLNMPPSVSLLF